MANRLSEAAGVVRDIALGGRRLRVAPLQVRDLAEVEMRVIQERRDPLALLAERWHDLPEAPRWALVEQAYEQLHRPPHATLAEIVQWMNTLEGTAFVLWLAARGEQPGLTWEECHALVLDAPLSVLERIQDALTADAEDHLGNCWGQTQLAEAASLGEASIAS